MNWTWIQGRIDGWWGAMDFVPEFKFNSFHVGICMFWRENHLEQFGTAERQFASLNFVSVLEQASSNLQQAELIAIASIVHHWYSYHRSSSSSSSSTSILDPKPSVAIESSTHHRLTSKISLNITLVLRCAHYLPSPCPPSPPHQFYYSLPLWLWFCRRRQWHFPHHIPSHNEIIIRDQNHSIIYLENILHSKTSHGIRMTPIGICSRQHRRIQ